VPWFDTANRILSALGKGIRFSEKPRRNLPIIRAFSVQSHTFKTLRVWVHTAGQLSNPFARLTLMYYHGLLADEIWSTHNQILLQLILNSILRLQLRPQHMPFRPRKVLYRKTKSVIFCRRENCSADKQQ